MELSPFPKRRAIEIANTLRHYLGTTYMDKNGRLNIVHDICIVPDEVSKRIELGKLYSDQVNGGTTTVSMIDNYLTNCDELEYNVVAVIEQQGEKQMTVFFLEFGMISVGIELVYGFNFQEHE